MSLLLLGISHRTAPIEERERLAVPEAQLSAALERLAGQPGIREGMILSTCNRVELLVQAEGAGQPPDLMHALALVTQQASLPAASLFYLFEGEAAARHLFRVASSLDSLVVGEPQILGQLKQAYAAAQSAQTIGPELEALLSRAFHAAKRVRTETGIAEQPVSVSQTAVELARQIFGGLEHKVVMLIGAGAVGQEAARTLLRVGAQQLLILNRTAARARELAAKFGGEGMGLEQLAEQGERADIIVTCAGAGQALITRTEAARFLARRRGRPLLFLDLAVPRDVEPAVHQLENAFVYNVDDLEQVVSSNRAGRQQEAQQAERVIEAEVRLYLERRELREWGPTIAALQEQAEAVRAGEWERVRKRLGALSPEQEQAVEALTRSLMQKWLHRPMVELRDSVRTADREALMELVHRLFALEARGDKRGA